MKEGRNVIQRSFPYPKLFSDHLWTGLQAFSKLRFLDVSFNCIASLTELTPLAFLHDLISVSDKVASKSSKHGISVWLSFLFFQFHFSFICHCILMFIFIVVEPSRESCCVLSILSTCHSCLFVSHTTSWTSELNQRQCFWSARNSMIKITNLHVAFS